MARGAVESPAMTSPDQQSKIEVAFLELYEREIDAVFRHCYLRVYSRERAKEIAQEGFCRAWNFIAEGKEVRHLRGFVYRIVNNLIVDESRKKREESLEVLQEDGFEPSNDGGMELLRQKIDAERVLVLLQKLEEPFREVLVLRYIDGFPPKEIAHILDITPDLVSVRLHRGKKMLREMLRNSPFFP